MNTFHVRLLCAVVVVACACGIVRAEDRYWMLGAGNYGTTAGEQDRFYGMTPLDRARMDWSYVTSEQWNLDMVKMFNEFLRINPRHKFVLRIWPVHVIQTGEHKHKQTFLDYLYSPGTKQEILDECTKKIRIVLDHIDKPENVIGCTFTEELPAHFTTEELRQTQELPLPWQLEHYRKQIEADMGRPLERWDAPTRLWWGKKFAEVVSEIHSHIKKESGNRLVFAYIQTNHRPLDWLAEGETIVDPLVLPTHWKDLIRPGVADGFFAYPNNQVIWDRYRKLASENDWVYFAQVAEPPYRLCSWEEHVKLAEVRDPHNLGYVFYTEGNDRRGDWNDDSSIPLDDNFRSASSRTRVRQYAAKHNVGADVIQPYLRPEVQLNYDLSKPGERFYPVYVYLRNTRDRTWYVNADDATLRHVKVTLSPPPGLELPAGISIPATVTIDEIGEGDARTILYWAEPMTNVRISDATPLKVTVEADGLAPQTTTWTTPASRIDPPQSHGVRRSGEWWYYPLIGAREVKTTVVRLECVDQQATMPALTISNNDHLGKVVWFDTLRAGQTLVIGPEHKATLVDKENPSGKDVTDRLGGSILSVNAYDMNRFTYEDMDTPAPGPKVRVIVETK